MALFKQPPPADNPGMPAGALHQRYRREDLLILWVQAALFLSLPLLFCLFLVGFIGLYPHLSAPLRAQRQGIVIAALIIGSALAVITLPLLFSGESLLAISALIATVKRAELRTERDRMVLVIAVFIVNALNLVYWNQLISLLHLFGLMGLMLWLMQETTEQSSRHGLTRRFTLLQSPAVSLVCWSLPLALLLFLFIPRLPGPLWDFGLAFGLPISVYEDLTPVSFTPGNAADEASNPLAKLQAQQQIVLVAEFTGAVPSKSRLYWRGPVSYGYDATHSGQAWPASTQGLRRSERLALAYRDIPAYQAMINHRKAKVSYDIKVAPHADHWLYAPDLPERNVQESFISKDGQLLAIRPLHQEFSYRMSSYLDGTLRPKQRPEVQHSALPAKQAEAIRRTAQQWHQASIEQPSNRAGELEPMTALSMAAEPHLAVTQSRPLSLAEEQALQQQVLDFLTQPPTWFESAPANSSEKFEYWTGLTMLLLQRAGLPARMVSGFRGGDLIALTNVIVVRQKHRHHWLELWQSDRGWVKIDIRDIFNRTTAGQETAKPVSAAATNSAKAEVTNAPSQSPDDDATSWLQTLEHWLHAYRPAALAPQQTPAAAPAETATSTWLWGAILLLLWFALLIYSRVHQQQPATMTQAWQQLRQALATQGIQQADWQCPSGLAAQLRDCPAPWSAAALSLVNHYSEFHYRAQSEVVPRTFHAQVKRLSSLLKDLPRPTPESDS